MKNKGFFWSITVALALACIYQLSFTMATSGAENDATEYGVDQLDSLTQFEVEYIVEGKDTLYVDDKQDQDRIITYYQNKYLKEIANEVIHFGYTYAECKGNEINLGLDLKGGMSVTLEISVPELVSRLAGDSRSPSFKIPYEKALERSVNGEGNFIELLQEEFESEGESMAKIFHIHNKEDIAADATNEEVVDFLNVQANSALDGVEIIIEKRVNSFGVAQPTIQKQPGSNRIYVELPGVKDKETVRRRLQSTANLEFFEVYNNAPTNEDGSPSDGVINLLSEGEKLLSQALFGDKLGTTETIEELNDTIPEDTTGVDPLLGNSEGSGDPLLEGGESEVTPDLDPTVEVETDKEVDSLEIYRMQQPIFAYLQPNLGRDETGNVTSVGQGSRVGFASVNDTSLLNARLAHPAFRSVMPTDLVFMWAAKEMQDDQGKNIGVIYLHAIKVPSIGPMVGGDDIDKAGFNTDPTTQEVMVTMDMTSIGAEKWREMSAVNIGKEVAITMDNIVYTSPVIQGEMTQGRSQITGNFTLEEASELSGLLNAGALPAPARIVDESIVGASIGGDNAIAGFYSFIFALCLVLVYMIFYYNKAGIVADLALIVNVFFLIGALASMKAILTLPGIAGIVLTIGMSVDANVLIFERIREELRHGKGVKGAIKDGYAKALAAILDANITTLLTGIVLAVFGTGPIKGFATTLIIGIFTSFFAAVVVTRLIFTFFIDRDKKISFSTKITENWFTNTAVPFVRKRKLFYIISAGIITIGTISLFTKGLDLGVDFQGGRQYKIQFQDEANYDGIRADLKVAFDDQEPNVKMVTDKFTAMVTTKYKITESTDSTNNEVQSKLENGLASYGEFEILESKMIAPTISKDLKTNSFYAVIFSLIIIFLYILFRFRKWQYGLGALIAMAHDVLIVLSLFSIFWGILPFSLEIDQAFIAAILTVVGYSINDTVVVFDRIREYLGIHTKKDQKEVINMALNSTLSRTINTSVSTFIVLLVIFLFGGGAIQGFTFALMIGVIVGTYSSLFIATPAVIDFSKKEAAKEIN